MKKFLLFTVICCFSVLKVYSQSSSSSATVVTPVAYTGAAPATVTYNLVLGTAQTFNTCVGSQSVYWFKFNSPNGTRSVKITANSASFSPIIDFYDAAVSFRQCVSGSIMRTTPSTNPVLAGQDFYFRVSSAALATGASFTLSVEYYPVAEVRTGFYPSVDADGYNKCELMKRNNIPTVTVTNTRFRLEPINSPNYGGCSAIVAGNNTIINTNQFSCVCFGIDYLCYVEVELDGHWCGESVPRTIVFQDYPATYIVTTNNSTIQMNGGQIDAGFVCNANYHWEITGQNGSVITSQTGTNSFVTLASMPCLRYNRVYQARVRLNSICNPNIWSPWSGASGANNNALQFFTPPMPTIVIPQNMCNTVLPQYAFMDVNFIAVVNNYHFQSTRVSPNAPYTPIAPPVVVLNNTNSGYNIVGNVAGATYRTCFKPSITSCNSPQEGSWGPYCYYSIAPGTAPSAMPFENSQEDIAAVQVVDESISENPQESDVTILKNGSETVLMVDLKEKVIDGTLKLRMYNVNGQLVYTDYFPNSTGVSVLQLSMPSDLVNGTYILQVMCDSYSTAEKVVFAGLN